MLTKFLLCLRVVVGLCGPLRLDADYKGLCEWLWAYWAAHNTYAWVRIWYVILTRLRVEEHRYSTSILMAGAICIGQAVGFYAIVVLVAFLWLHAEYLKWSCRRLAAAVEAGDVGDADAFLRSAVGAAAWVECARTPPVGPPGSASFATALRLVDKYLIDTSTPDATSYNDDAKGGLVFDLVDEDASGVLEADELVKFLLSFGCAAADVRRLFAKLPATQDATKVTHEDFVTHFEPFWSFLFPLYLEELHRRFDDSRGGRSKFEALHATATAARRESACPFAAAFADRGNHQGLDLLRSVAAAGSDAADAAAKTLGFETATDLSKSLQGAGPLAHSQWAAFTAGSRRSRKQVAPDAPPPSADGDGDDGDDPPETP